MTMVAPSEVVNNGLLIVLGILGVIGAHHSIKNNRELREVKALSAHTMETGEAIYKLSNGRVTALLTVNMQFAKSIAVMAHRMAEVTRQAGDEAAALAADVQARQQEALLTSHLLAQAQVELQHLQKLRGVSSPGGAEP